MNKIAVLSNSLNTLKEDCVISSSQKYELSLAFGLTQFFDRVIIVSSSCTQEIHWGKICIKSAKRLSKHCADFFSVCKKEKVTHVLMYGYDPRTLLQLIRLKNKCKIFSIVFDTHKGMIEFYRPVRKLFIDFYYLIGIKMLNFLNGIILFKEEAYHKLHLSIPVLLSTVTGNYPNILKSPDIGNPTRNIYTVFYAGAITNYNHIKEICEAALLFPNDGKVIFFFFGDGPLLNEMEKQYGDDKRINFYGRKRNKDVVAAMQKADLVLNIRRVGDDVNDFSYPSKLIEYLENRKTILSTNINEKEPLYEVVYLLENVTPQTIYRAIKRIMTDKDGQIEKAERMKKYLLKYHNRKTEIIRIASFILNCDKTISEDTVK